LGVDFIFRLQKRNYSKLWEQILSGELDFDFILENEKLKNKMKGQKVRVIVLTLANGETEVLVTSLFDREKFTLEDISKAYVLRWHIEETTQSRSRIREFFGGKFRGCITRILGELGHVQYIIASYV